jgi:hypothetical protein
MALLMLPSFRSSLRQKPVATALSMHASVKFVPVRRCGRSVRSMASKSPRTSSQRQPRGHSSQSSRAPRV